MQSIGLLALCCILSAEASSTSNEIWSKWKQLHEKTYGGKVEELARKRQFEINLEMISQHNLKHDVGMVSYTMKVNQFSDLSRDEFKELYLCNLTPKGSKGSVKCATTKMSIADILSAPDHVDWREEGLVTEVKQQGQCGSCWAFSAGGAVEGQFAKKFKKQVNISEQQLVDCSGDYGNLGCDGGFMEYAYEYIIDMGLEDEDTYPYTAKDDKCVYDAAKVVVNITSYINFTSGDEDALKAAVAKYGPVSVAIDVEGDFAAYGGGIFSSDDCSTEYLNHGVLIVGYGTEDGQDYWIVKNSWGSRWGEEGYIRVARNKSNMCGIATDTNVPLI